jgi:hypothetical protein
MLYRKSYLAVKMGKPERIIWHGSYWKFCFSGC